MEHTTNDDTGEGRDRGPATGTPRWVWVFGAIIIVLLLVLIVLQFVGGGHGPGRHRPAGDASGLAPSSAGGPAAADAAARTVEITALDTMAFEPGGIDVSPGETVTFVVTNAGALDHEFTVGDAAMQRQKAEMMAHMPPGLVHDTPNSITLPPGETRQMTWRFGDAGTLEYACHVPGHYEAGMRGQISVG